MESHTIAVSELSGFKIKLGSSQESVKFFYLVVKYLRNGTFWFQYFHWSLSSSGSNIMGGFISHEKY